VLHLSLGEQKEKRLSKKVNPREAHDRVVSPVLVTDQKPSEGIENKLSIVESGSEGVEEPRGDDEEWQVLKIGVEVEAVARNVVRIVVPLPPGNADSGENVAGKDLRDAVEAAVEHDVVVARVMANPAALNPEDSDQGGGEQVHARAVGEDDAADAEREEGEDDGEQDEGGVALAFEELEIGELGEELAVVRGGGGDGVVGEEGASGECGEEGGGGGGVEGEEGVGGVCAGDGEKREGAARVAVEPGGDVVDFAVD